MARRSAAIVVRAFALDANGNKVPVVPAGWTAIYEDAGWVTLRRASMPGAFMHAWLACEQGANGVWLLVGPRAWVDAIVALVQYAWSSLPALRADNGAAATQVKAAWVAQHGSAVVVSRVAGFLDDDGEDPGP